MKIFISAGLASLSMQVTEALSHGTADMEILGKRGDLDSMLGLAKRNPQGGGRRGGGNGGNGGNGNGNGGNGNDNEVEEEEEVAGAGLVGGLCDDIEACQAVCKDLNFCTGQEIETESLENAPGKCVPVMQGFLPSFDNMGAVTFVTPLALDHFDVQEEVQASIVTAGYDVVPQPGQRPLAPQSLSGNGVLAVSFNFCSERITGNAPGEAEELGCVPGEPDGQGASANLGAMGDSGLFRVCAIPSVESGLCPIMPKAQRTAEHSCRYYVVKQGGAAGPDTVDLPGIFGNCQVTNNALDCADAGAPPPPEDVEEDADEEE